MKLLTPRPQHRTTPSERRGLDLAFQLDSSLGFSARRAMHSTAAAAFRGRTAGRHEINALDQG